MDKRTSNLELNNFLLYTAPSGEVKVEVLFEDETIWATQKMMAELFGVDVRTVSEHLRNIFESLELQADRTIRKFRIVQKEGSRGVSRDVDFYNLDAIISVGYRVNSSRATQFRIWATERLREFIIKGFVLDDDRLANGQYFGEDYFNELLERIRSIRASERRVWQQITDIFQECSIDYDKNSPITKDFFATVQNKFHYAITGQTAAEIVHSKANKDKPNMGLTTWRSGKKGRILKSDVSIAKNYLSQGDIKRLERAVSSFFDYIEGVVERRTAFTMEQFAKSVNKFLEFNEYQVLEGKGIVSADTAKKKAESEYNQFNKTQKIINDFEKSLRRKVDT